MPSIPSFLQRTSPPRDFDFVLNQLPQASFIWDIRQRRIISCNGKLIELTGKTKQELLEVSLQDLFPHLTNLGSSEATTESSTRIATKSGASPVRVQISNPGSTSGWILVRLETEQNIQQKEVTQSILKQRWEALHVLALAPLHEDQESSFRQCLQAGQLLTAASFLGIYLPVEDAANEFHLAYSWGDVSEFPASIPISEISHLRIPYVWQPGVRATSILHQKSLEQQIAYLATSPIDQSAPLTGILMVGDYISNPPEELIQMLQVVTGLLETCRVLFGAQAIAEKESFNLKEKISISELIKDSIADGLILVDDEKKIIDINSTAAVTLGYSADEVLGKTVDQILIGEISIKDVLDEHNDQNFDMQNMGEVRLHRRDGVPILINLRLMPLHSKTLRSSAAILLSDLSKHEEILQRSKKLEDRAVLGEVMAIFAHEVRNPINNFGMGLQVMAASFDEDHPLQEEIGRMKQDVDRLEDLMKSVLSVSRATEYKMKPVNVRMLLERLVARWSPRMGRYKIEKKLICPEDVPPVKGDTRALEQVFTNLIQNAINSMKADGGTLSIRITHEEKNPLVSIDIIDTGLGIPPEIKDQIFEPFFTTNPEGTGLGLAITKRIIVAHNGRIKVVDSFPGGTVFRIQLPIA